MKKKHLSHKTVLLLGGALLIWGFFFYKVVEVVRFVTWSNQVSEYCQQEAMKIVGDNWAQTVPANQAEIAQFPGLTEISIGFREQLKCEHNPAVLDKFPFWF